jgi:hypothetical protein
MSPGNLIVRANYLAVVVCALFLALFVAVYLLSGEPGTPTKDWTVIAWILLPTIFLFVLPGARAVRRVFSNGTVVPPELVHERPVVAWVVTLAGGLGGMKKGTDLFIEDTPHLRDAPRIVNK